MQDRFEKFGAFFKQYFSFLQKDFGFSDFTTSKNENYILLECKADIVYFKSYYGVPDFNVDFLFGRIDVDNKNDFSSGDLLYLSKSVKPEFQNGFMAHDVSNLKYSIKHLSNLLLDLGKPCLRGDNYYYNKIIFTRKKELNKLHRENTLTNIRKDVEKAWKNKNYLTVVKLLKSIKHDLKSSEQLKLKLAKKKIKLG